MDSWTLQGDSYSFLRSAPRNFSLCHRDGTPNHVEIFDIINVPTQRSAISETTCLCDIFGDDCESQSLSSSPAVVAFVPTQRELDPTAAVSPSVDDQNDSSGSYHTAPGSSEGEEGSEDSRERFYSPPLQSEYSEKRLSEDKVTDSGHPEVSEDSNPNLKTKNKSPAPQQNQSSPSTPVFNTDQRTPTPGHTSSCTVSPEGRLSSLSSSSFEKRHSPSSPDSKQINPEAEPSTITSSKDRHSSASNQFLTTSPSLEDRNCVNSSSSESANTQFFPDSLSQNSSPLPRQTFEDLTESTFEPRTYSSPFPSSCQSKLSNSRETPVSPGLSDTLSFPDTQASSPFPELRGRVSLPDLLSRGSTPEIETLTHTELISAIERDFTPSPEIQNQKLLLEPGSNNSTPAPRHTPPSPVISVTTSPELVKIAASPELRNIDHSITSSPSLLSAASPTRARTSTPSRDPSPCLKFSEGRTQLSSPAVNYSLSPSPGIRDSCSPTQYRYTSPSPEIRITASSPELSKGEQSPSLPEPLTDLAISGSPTSSPHISGISYSVVQPEDRHSPPFPELSHLSSPEPDQILMSTDAPVESTHPPGLVKSISQSEISKVGDQTSSPQLIYRTPSPDSRTQTLSPDKCQRQNKSRDLSPVSPLSGHDYQHSPATLSRGSSPRYTRSVTSLESTPDIERDCCEVDITDEQSHTFLAKHNESPLFGPGSRNNLAATEIKHRSPAAFQSPVVSPVSSEKSRNTSPKHRGRGRQKRSTDINAQHKSSIVFVSEEENQALISQLFQKKEPNYHPSIDLPDTDPIQSKNRSPVRRATSHSPVQTVEIPHSQLNSYSLPSENGSALKPTYPPENSSRQLPTKVKRETRARSTEDMSRHVNRRRTPSPPITRFTPVHIIAPEKPYRHWQNRRHSPPQARASPPSGNLKKAVTNRESPDVAPVDTNSQAPWVRPGWQLEKEMQLEQERVLGRERQRDREMKKERKREEWVPEKEVGWQGGGSCRGEQVELSFSARNRKGPVSRSAAPTSRETRQGLPTVHSYSEGLLATRQLQQQQNLLRLASQQETRGGGTSRRQHPDSKNSVSRRVSTNRPSRSSSSSMGSELDEADNEVKWFTDLAFRSLSSPEVDYLDMYNSSHRSSTNISQPSTQESPAGVSAAWPAYADFRGSAPRLDQDELTTQQPSAYYSDGLDPSRRYELGSYECVDVAVEREDSRKSRRGVPKRQIQLKRRNTAEGNLDESSENSSPGLPVMVESPSQENQFRGTFVRQNSTPAAIQECYPTERSPDLSQQNDKKSKLQKSASMDETCSKTKMATCLIKSVLSKKMQSTDNQPVEQEGEDVSSSFDENNPPSETEGAPLKVSPKPYSYNLSSSHPSDHSPLSEGLPPREELSTKDDTKPPKGFGMRPVNRPNSSSSSRSVNFSLTDSEEADSQSTNVNLLRTETISDLKVPFDCKHSVTGVQQPSDSKTYAKDGGDSANANAWNTGASSATGASSTQVTETNRDQECENMEDHKQLQASDKDACKSKPQEITIKAVEKKKTSLNVSLTPEVETKPETSFPNVSFREKEDVTETRANVKTEEDGNDNTHVKAPIHKVRDVRRLVKNTYNLSFKATSTVTPSNVNEEKTESCEADMVEDSVIGKERDVRPCVGSEDRREEREGSWIDTKEEQKEGIKNFTTSSPSLQVKGKSLGGPQPIQIECKAVRWKEDQKKTSCVSDSENPGDRPQAPCNSFTEVSRESQSLNSQDCKTEDTTVVKLCDHNVRIREETQETTGEIHKVSSSDNKHVVVRTDRKPPMLGSLPKLPSKEREVSTAVVLIREGSNKTKTSASPVQEEIPNLIQTPAASLSPESMTSGSHSVSMLLKEKGFQADIGAVVGDNQNTPGDKRVPRKHVNSLEIPLQTNTISDGSCMDSHRERTFSSTSTTSGPSARTDNTDKLTKTTEDEAGSIKPTGKDMEKQKRNTYDQTPPLTRQKELGDFESVKRMDPTFPPRSPAIRRFKPQPIEVKSLSKEPQKKENPPNTTGSNRPQTIEVKSIAKNSQKPVVPPKPNCKFKPADLGSTSIDAQRPSTTASSVKGEERTQTIVVSSPTIYRKIPNDSTSTSSYSRKLAVSTVSSLKPPPSKPASAIIPDQSNQSTAAAETEVPNDRRQPTASSQSSSHAQTPVTSTTARASAEGSSANSETHLVSDSNPNQISGPASTGASQPSQPAVMGPDNQLRYPRPAYPHEQALPPSKSTKQAAAVSTAQVPRYSHQSCRRSLSSERSQRTDDLRFYASDDPPSYDERESFSPLMLPDLTPLRSNRYQVPSHPPPCSCTAGCPSHPGLTPPHHHHSPHNLTPPAPPHSPGQPQPYPVVQPSLRPHQCRPEPQPLNYQPGSPKSSLIGPNQPPAMYQPLHQSAPCPPHPSLMQPCPVDRPIQPPQHIDPRRPPIHRSPHQQPPGITGAPYSDTGHSHSPGLPPMDPQYLCGPQSMGPSYGSEYGGDSSSLYSESSFTQAPRRVLMDPETGKYFYIEVPVQPLRKMLFDPETGQYVEVLIPQQTVSHSALYPPSAAPYPPLPNPNMYAPAPQYMPYAAPPPPAHPQAQPQPPRYPEASATAAMHPSGSGVSYRNPSSQGSKPDSQTHPPLDHSYLESMYYVPTGMNASPNPTPPDYYHKHPPNLPPTGGKRS